MVMWGLDGRHAPSVCVRCRPAVCDTDQCSSNRGGHVFAFFRTPDCGPWTAMLGSRVPSRTAAALSDDLCVSGWRGVFADRGSSVNFGWPSLDADYPYTERRR